MGYYIEAPTAKGKAQYIVDKYDGLILNHPPSRFSDLREGEALICVVENDLFEAAGFCHSQKVFEQFSSPDSVSPPGTFRMGKVTQVNLGPGYQRPRTWIVMDWDKACELTGYKERT